MQTQNFSVTGMTCSACSAHVEKAVRAVPGVESVSVSLLTNSMTVSYAPEQTSDDAICAAVDKAGYGAFPKRAGSQAKGQTAAPDPQKAARAVKRRLIVSFVFLIPLFYISMGHMMGAPLPHFFHGEQGSLVFAFTQFLLVLPILAANHSYFSIGFKALWNRAPNMDSLIAIGSSAAVVYGIFAIYQIGWGLGTGDLETVRHYSMDLYFESAGMILTLITLGKFLEARAKGKTSEAITRLMDLTPKTALLMLENGETRPVPIEEVRAGDRLLVRPGDTVPVDGVIVRGGSAIDEAAITGESIPVDKQEGDTVTGGTLNKTGSFELQATRVGDDTTLSQIIRLMEEASSSKAPIAKLADRVSGVFVPIVIGIAVLAAVVWLLVGQTFEFALTTMIAVLVISCPCALGLATPTAIMVGTGKGAEHGILIKSAEALELLCHTNTVVLDKTGTITQGQPEVTAIVTADGVSQEDLLRMAAALEGPSEHPLAEAVVRRAAQDGITPAPVDGFEALMGRGVTARLGGEVCLAGNPRLMAEQGVALGALEAQGQQLSQQGSTPLYFARAGKAVGLIAAADVVRPTSRQAIALLREAGVEPVMLTGDNETTAKAMARNVGIERVFAQVLPQDKESVVRTLQEEGRKVAMVGDGINDAPALARADVGVAIGAGTDVAIESADVILMKSDLLDFVSARQLSRAVVRNIKENLFWALFYNSIGIPLAAGVFFTALGWSLNPMFAATAMSLSSVCVVTNALRLRFFKPNLTLSGALQPAAEPRLQNAAPACPTACPATSDNVCPVNEKGEENMSQETRTLKVEGMTCPNCVRHVKNALEGLGVTADVDLASGTAVVHMTASVADDQLKKAVTDAGYTVTDIQ